MRTGPVTARATVLAITQRKPHAPPVRNPPPPRPGVQLTPIRWGQRDADLARAVCWHIADATPAIRIPFNPFHHRRLTAFLRSHGIAH